MTTCQLRTISARISLKETDPSFLVIDMCYPWFLAPRDTDGDVLEQIQIHPSALAAADLEVPSSHEKYEKWRLSKKLPTPGYEELHYTPEEYKLARSFLRSAAKHALTAYISS